MSLESSKNKHRNDTYCVEYMLVYEIRKKQRFRKFEDDLGFNYDLVRAEDPKWGTFEVSRINQMKTLFVVLIIFYPQKGGWQRHSVSRLCSVYQHTTVQLYDDVAMYENGIMYDGSIVYDKGTVHQNYLIKSVKWNGQDRTGRQHNVTTTVRFTATVRCMTTYSVQQQCRVQQEHCVGRIILCFRTVNGMV
jgi:hypothetical protein